MANEVMVDAVAHAVDAFPPVATKADLDTLDSDDILAGYLSFTRDDPEPGANRGRAFWHGWMNAARDHGARPMTPESRQLAGEMLAFYRSHRDVARR
jgi:hypothetical protein